MKTKHLIIEVPDDFKSDGRTRYACDWCINKSGCNANVFYCPIANGKEAVVVNPKDEAYFHPGLGWRINGKPVTLYAVEVEK